MEMVEPSGASARRPSSTYRASNVRLLAASDNWRSVAGPVSPLPYNRPAGGSDRRAQGFRELDDRLAAPGMRHTHDNLAGTDDLPRLGQSFDDHAVRIGEEDGVARFVDVGLRLGRVEVRLADLRPPLAS